MHPVKLLEHDKLFLSDQPFIRLTYRLCSSHQGLVPIDEQSYLPEAEIFFSFQLLADLVSLPFEVIHPQPVVGVATMP